MPEILRAAPNTVLLLAGDGALAKKTRRLANGLGVAASVQFLGYLPDTSPYLKACDMAVSASLSEGLPLGIMEALVSGLPVAASRVKGHVDLLPEACLFDPRAPREIALRCREAAQNHTDSAQKEMFSAIHKIFSKEDAANVKIALILHITQ
jgi:glycosyltransferase involved in cell wall biosynthesis